VKSDVRKLITHHSPLITFLRFWFGFPQAGDLVAGFALAALFKKRRALETFEDIALAAQGGRRAETAML
jgi:hypothetical protein